MQHSAAHVHGADVAAALGFGRPTQALRVLHITGRSDHGGGPEHIYHLLSSTQPQLVHYVACPRSGVYWQRYANLVGEDRLFDIPHRKPSLTALVALARKVNQWGIDLVHSHGMCAGVCYGRPLRMITSRPCVHTFHGIPVNLTAKHAVYRLVELGLSRFTDVAVAVSDGERDLVLSRYPSYAGRLVVIPNGIEAHDDAISSSRLRIAASGRRKVVSFTRSNKQKHPELFLGIAARLRDAGRLDEFEFHLYGEGLRARPLRERIIAEGLSPWIRLHPSTNHPRVALRGAFAYLSTSRWEGMPLSLLEATREGVPIIASDVVGNRDLIIDGRDGLLFPNEDAAGAADCLLRLSDVYGLPRRLITEARQRLVTQHHREVMTDRLVRIYGTAAT